jgi:hypothetical protein
MPVYHSKVSMAFLRIAAALHRIMLNRNTRRRNDFEMTAARRRNLHLPINGRARIP